jgi:uronate dehydrogenase
MLAQETWVLTGAAGQVASCLRPALTGRVGRLRLLDLAAVAAAGPHEEAVRCDLRDLDGLTAALRGAAGAIHLGGLPDEAAFADLAEVNISGTQHLLEAARRSGVRRVVFASTNHVTGMYPSSVTVSPSMPTRPDTFYGASKAAGEALCRLYAEKFGLEVACIRIGTFAPAPSDERSLSTWLSPADCAAAFLAAMTAPALVFATFYGVSRNTRRFWDLAAGEALGFDPQDDAERYAAAIAAPAAAAADPPQGGRFATAAYTLERQG